MDRQEELSLNLNEVASDIERACQEAGRDRQDVTLIAVTKTWPASDVSILANLGVTDVGENRDQEAKPKHEEVANDALVWHAIGQLQTNKAKSVASWADVVHSVDRPELVKALGKAVTERVKPLGVLIQVNLDPVETEHRGGTKSEDVLDLAELINQTPNLNLLGVMGVAPLEGEAAPAFEKLQQVSQDVKSKYPEAKWISAGMSGDYEEALKYGATHLRIGSSILGKRLIQG